MRDIIFSPEAKDDIADVLEYLDEHSPAFSAKMASGIAKQTQLLAKFPGLGRARDELRAGLRSSLVDRYILFFTSTDTSLEIVRFIDGRRDLESIFDTQTEDE